MSKPHNTASPDFSTNEWLFQISTLDKSLDFIDRSWCLLIGNGAPEALIAENENIRDGGASERAFMREETPHVLREAREAVTALRELSLDQAQRLKK